MKGKVASQRFVAGTSRGSRRATTFLAQMADFVRGERIKQLRKNAHLTQPAVAELVGVTLRAYQEWEAGGGIQWDNVKKLAKILGVPPEDLMRDDESPPEPENNPLQELSAKLDEVVDELKALKAQGDSVERLREAIENLKRTVEQPPKPPPDDEDA